MQIYIEQILRRDFCLGSVVQFLQTILFILKSRTKDIIVYTAPPSTHGLAHNLALSDATLKEHRLLISICDPLRLYPKTSGS